MIKGSRAIPKQCMVRRGCNEVLGEKCLLILDVHKAQKTNKIKDLLKNESNTSPGFVPAGCTSIVQPLDVSCNAPFKKKVENAAMQHLQNNLDSYLHGKFTPGERRVLLTKWVVEAWDEISQNNGMAVRSFRKCGISVAADGSEDFDINLEGLNVYRIDYTDDSYTDVEDPFADMTDDGDDTGKAY